MEQSNNAEEQIMVIAVRQLAAILQEVKEFCENLLVSDSQVTLTGLTQEY